MYSTLKHYFKRAEYDTEGENGPSETSMGARRKLADRETHFYHTLADTIITECVERGVGTLAVSRPDTDCCNDAPAIARTGSVIAGKRLQPSV